MSRLDKSVIEMCNILYTKLAELDDNISVEKNEEDKYAIVIKYKDKKNEFKLTLTTKCGDFLATDYALKLDDTVIMSRIKQGDATYNYMDKLYKDAIGYLTDKDEEMANNKICKFVNILKS